MRKIKCLVNLKNDVNSIRVVFNVNGIHHHAGYSDTWNRVEH